MLDRFLRARRAHDALLDRAEIRWGGRLTTTALIFTTHPSGGAPVSPSRAALLHRFAGTVAA